MKVETLEVSNEDFERISQLIQSHPELGYESPREFVLSACYWMILRLRTRVEESL